MAFIKKQKVQIGNSVTTTIEHESINGIFTIGSKVTITAIDPIRGYSIKDDEGNEMIEIGWIIQPN